MGGEGEGEGEGRGCTRTSGGGREQHEGVVVLERTEARRLAVNHLPNANVTIKIRMLRMTMISVYTLLICF